MKMFARTMFAAAIALVAAGVSAPNSALDRVLQTPRIKDNGDIRLSDDLKLGRFQGSKTTLTPDALQIQGPGSTGPIDGMSLTPILGGTTTPVASRAARQPLISDYGPAAGDGTDATDAIRATMASTASPTVTVPPGVYRLADCTALQAASSTSFTGAGKEISIIRLAPGSVCAGPLFAWIEKGDIRFTGLTVDLNGATYSGNSYSGTLASINNASFFIDNNEIIGGGAGFFNLVDVNGGSSITITRNRLRFASCATSFNHAIQVGSSYMPARNVKVADNTIVNSGTFFGTYSGLSVTGNDIQGTCYGAGIALQQIDQQTNALVAYNTIHDLGLQADTDATVPSGIEGWGTGTQFIANKIFHVGAQCIFAGGKNSVASGNSCRGWGKGFAAGAKLAAYAIGYASATFNGSGTTLSGNTATLDGASPSEVGISVIAGVTGAVIGSNSVAGAVATYLDAGTGTTNPDAGWTAFTPTVTPTGGGGVTATNPVGKYRLTGKTIAFRLTLRLDYTTAPIFLDFNTPPGVTLGSFQPVSVTNATSGQILTGFVSASGTSVRIAGGAGSIATGSGQFIGVNFQGETN